MPGSSTLGTGTERSTGRLNGVSGARDVFLVSLLRNRPKRDDIDKCRRRTMTTAQAQPLASEAFRHLRWLIAGYIGVTILTLVAIVVLSGHHDLVNDDVWTRGVGAVISSLLLFRATRQAERGSRRAFNRLRIVSAIILVVLATIAILPGVYPAWMRIDQGICSLLMLGVVVFANRQSVRGLFKR